MSRFRLRYRNADLEMPFGEFVVGRSPSCNLALDDALVSRRHAVLRTSSDGVVVEDLGSRNGVLVNGARIEGTKPLAHGDVVTIGEHELQFQDREAAPSGAPGTAARRRLEAAALRKEKLTAELDLAAIARASGLHPQREVEAFRLVSGAGIAEKSLGLGRFEEAERILARHLDGALERARNREQTEDDVFDKAIDYALRLSEGPRSTRYIDYVLELHAATRRLMAEAVIDRLHELVRKTRYRERAAIDAYTDLLEAMSSELSAADRFIVRRLAALKRVITA